MHQVVEDEADEVEGEGEAGAAKKKKKKNKKKKAANGDAPAAVAQPILPHNAVQGTSFAINKVEVRS